MIEHDELQILRTSLENGSPVAELSEQAPAIYRRLARAWPHGTAADLAVLLRHILRFESERSSGTYFLLIDAKDPRFAKWRSAQWDRFGLTAGVLESPSCFRLSARPWRPDWLDSTGLGAGESPETQAFKGTVRRSFESATGDAAIAALGRQSYLCPGQQSAVRAVLAMPAGATLLINLPTGSGKSLCAQVLAAAPFARDEGTGVVVVAVPTTSLCLDQARAVMNLVPHSCAFHGGTALDERRAIFARLFAGDQRILFASPESLMHSLRPALYGAARSGYLRTLIVDEAHMIEQWGDEFRPAFQELAGLRRGLQRESRAHAPHAPALRTVLLSATWTENAVRTAKALFGSPEVTSEISGKTERVSDAAQSGDAALQMSATVQLRPEPALWMAPCQAASVPAAEALRAARVLEALHHLPRPLILYTSKVEDADLWFNQLRKQGFDRLALMTGKTGGDERKRIVDSWAQGALDMVVATSAFGLGIDQSEVRAVVHACVPENLDRFYQEIGRGGRDGRASLSLIIYTRVPSRADWKTEEDDLAVASGIGKKRIITLELGLARWKAMFASKTPLPDGRYQVPLDAMRGLDMDNSYNRDWNSRTLTLMSRAGVLTLDDEAPVATVIQESATAQEAEESLFPIKPTRVITILKDRHLEEEFWDEEIEPQRDSTARAQKAGLKRMRELLEGKRCAAEVLAENYVLPAGLIGNRSVPVARSCGGCPACRRVGREPFSHEAVPSRFPWKPLRLLGAGAHTLFGNGSLVVLFYDEAAPKTLLARFSKLLGWSVKQGMRGFIAPAQWRGDLAESQKSVLQSRGVFTLAPDELDINVPTVLFHPAGEGIKDWHKWKRRFDSPELYAPLLLMLPANTPDPERSDRLLRELATFPCWSLSEWEARFSA